MLFLICILTAKQYRKLVTLFLLSSLLYITPGYSQCLSIRRSGNIVQTESNSGQMSIDNPENVKLADGIAAIIDPTAMISLGGQLNSKDLTIKDFNFNIPPLSVICGVEARIKRKASAFISLFTGVKDNQVRLLKNGITAGNNSARETVWRGSDASDGLYVEYGGSHGLWGTTLTPADVNNKDFGLSLALSFTGLVSLLPKAEIDHVEIEVYYQPIIVLPLILSDFSAALRRDKVYLQWSLLQQQAGSTILVERMNNAKSWVIIYHQLLSSDLPRNFTYSFVDIPEHSNTYSYRLKIILPDGSIQYSKENVVSVTTSSTKPVLFTQKGNQLIMTHWASGNTINLFNSDGQQLNYKVHTANSTSLIDISHLSTGIYFLSSNGQIQKFFKQ